MHWAGKGEESSSEPGGGLCAISTVFRWAYSEVSVPGLPEVELGLLTAGFRPWKVLRVAVKFPPEPVCVGSIPPLQGLFRVPSVFHGPRTEERTTCASCRTGVLKNEQNCTSALTRRGFEEGILCLNCVH